MRAGEWAVRVVVLGVVAAAIGHRPARAQQAGACAVETDIFAAPREVRVLDSVGITLSLRASCRREVDIVLVLDNSGSMAGRPLSVLKTETQRFVDDLELPVHPERRVGVVTFSQDAKVMSGLTNNAVRLRSALGRMSAGGGTAIDEGLEAGDGVLRSGAPAAHGLIVVLTDGGNNRGCRPVTEAARRITLAGVALASVCYGRDCDQDCMRKIAAPLSLYFEADDAGHLHYAYGSIRAWLYPAVRQVRVRLSPAPALDPLPSSETPPRTKGEAPITWVFESPVADRITMTLGARARSAGLHAVAADVRGVLTDTAGATGTFTFSVPVVLVRDVPTLGATSTTVPTRAPTLPVPSATTMPTTEPTAPAPSPSPIFLPRVSRPAS